jgi:hypothetical protein
VIELSLPALVESSDDRFFFSVKDLDRMKEGRKTCCPLLSTLGIPE